MKIKVTREHINKGFTGSCARCPIALALKEVFDNEIYVLDDKVELNITKAKLNHRFHLPRTAQRFIKNFDKYNRVNPFTFDLKELS